MNPFLNTLPGVRVGLVCLCAFASATVLGCFGENSTELTQSEHKQKLREINKSNALINSVTDQLRDLPNRIGLELSPPAVVLDSTSSSNGLDVFAVAGSTYEASEFPLPNLITIPSGNANLISAGIKPGDTIKCYLLPDAEFRTRLRESGEQDTTSLSYDAVEAEITQVTGPNTLLVNRGLRLPLGAAKELAAGISEEQRKLFVENGQPADFVEQIIQALDLEAIRTQGEGIPLPAGVIQMLPQTAWPFRIEIWRTLDDTMNEINNSLGRYALGRNQSLGWEPTGDAADLKNIVERLNQWARSRKVPADWKPASLLESLPSDLREASALKALLAAETLSGTRYADHDGRLIQEAIWLRDIGQWASGGDFDPVAKVTNLFDWTTRNITLSDDLWLQNYRPWQSLVYGRGSAAQRAWVFTWLCRQQRLPTVVIEIPNGDSLWLWCALIHDGKAYLFDPQLGLPVTNASGEVATLAEVRADGQLLRQLDLPSQPYPVDAEKLGQAETYVVADPLSLSWRAQELQQQFSAADALTLTTDADVLAAEATSLDSIGKAKLWPKPFEMIRRQQNLGKATRKAIVLDLRPYTWRPRLWKARVLHLRGKLETKAEARKKDDALYEPLNDHRSAGRLYTDRFVRPSEAKLAEVVADKASIYRRAKADATYWMGVLQYERGAYSSAVQWLEMAANAKTDPTSRADGIQYNLARALEADGNVAAAAALLEQSSSPQQHGDRIRAQRLLAQASEDDAS